MSIGARRRFSPPHVAADPPAPRTTSTLAHHSHSLTHWTLTLSAPLTVTPPPSLYLDSPSLYPPLSSLTLPYPPLPSLIPYSPLSSLTLPYPPSLIHSRLITPSLPGPMPPRPFRRHAPRPHPECNAYTMRELCACPTYELLTSTSHELFTTFSRNKAGDDLVGA